MQQRSTSQEEPPCAGKRTPSQDVIASSSTALLVHGMSLVPSHVKGKSWSQNTIDLDYPIPVRRKYFWNSLNFCPSWYHRTPLPRDLDYCLWSYWCIRSGYTEKKKKAKFQLILFTTKLKLHKRLTHSRALNMCLLSLYMALEQGVTPIFRQLTNQWECWPLTL